MIWLSGMLAVVLYRLKIHFFSGGYKNVTSQQKNEVKINLHKTHIHTWYV